MFDYVNTAVSDLMQLFQVCVLPFKNSTTVTRLFSAGSFELREYQRMKNSINLQKIMFDDSNNHWDRFPYDIDQCIINRPLNLSWHTN